MSKKNTKKAVAVVVAPKTPKVKVPKFKLVSYTLKAVIPVGQYANIQPEITVQAQTIEAAERAVMPYIETLFAKYREGVPVNVRVPMVTVSDRIPSGYSELMKTTGAVIPPNPSVSPTPVAPKPPVAPVAAPIVLTVPFNRAKGAIDSCMSSEALKLVADQIEKSTKLIDTEKNQLRALVSEKVAKMNNSKAA